MPTPTPTLIDRDERRVHALAESLRRAFAASPSRREIRTIARAALDVDRHEDPPPPEWSKEELGFD
jgi:hypothetical protein